MPPQPDLIPAIGYIRVSTAREEMISPEIQRAAIEDWARRNGRRIIEWIIDLDKSGRTFKRRVQEAIQRIRDGIAKEIVVWKFSRFGRIRLGWAVHLDLVESAGGSLISATEDVDARTATGKLTRGMLAELAAFESDRASEQWKETHAHRLARGLPASGRPRYGYVRRGRLIDPHTPHRTYRDQTDPAGERYEPDPDTAEILADLYRRYVAGAGFRELVAWLNSHGHGNACGSQWTVNGLRGVLDSGFAAGLLRVHNPECEGCDNVSACRNRIHIPGAQKPVIDRDLWERYLRRRKKVAVTPPRARKPAYVLTGLMVCGHCYRSAVHYPTGDKRGVTVRCSTYNTTGRCRGLHVKRARVEEVVLAALAGWAEEIDRAAAAVPVPRSLRPHPPDRDRLAGELAKVDKALVRLTTQRAMDEDMPDAVYESSRAELLAQRARIAAQVERAEAPEVTAADYAPILAGVLAEWDILSTVERQAMLGELVRHVTIRRAERRGPAEIVVIPVWEECPDPCCAERHP